MQDSIYSINEQIRKFIPLTLLPEEEMPPARKISVKKIQKRDGRVVAFNKNKITRAIFKSMKASGQGNRGLARALTEKVCEILEDKFDGVVIPQVEQIQDIVEKALMDAGLSSVAKTYILYRQERNNIREARSTLLDAVAEIEKEANRENANVGASPSAKMLQIATAASRAYYLNRLIPRNFSDAHKSGAIHIHDLDYYAKTLNCLQIGLGELWRNGFNTGHGYIRPPKRIASAAAQACIILQSNQNDMYGGQSFPHFDKDFSPFLKEYPASEDHIFQVMESIVYNLNSMHSRAGAQVPFSSVNLGTDTTKEGRQIISAFLEAYDRGLGHGEQPIWPNFIFRLKKGINFEPGDPNYDLYQKALRVTARRMNPTYSFMDASFNSKYGDEVAYMGCRTRVIGNRHGPEVAAKRGNIAFTTINLPRIAFNSKSPKDFFKNLNQIINLCGLQLLHRYDVLKNVKVRDVPFLMGQHLYLDSEKLKEDDSIEPCMRHGTLTISFVGLAETLKILTGKHHGQSKQSQRLGLKIIEHLKTRCDELSEKYDKNFTLLATPAEQAAGRFAAFDQKIFGKLPGVTDKEYYTNSFHVPVDFEISSWEKIALEGPYHKYNNAGHITYVELESAPTHNTQAIDKILRHMLACDVGYAGINFPIDECLSCHFIGLMNKGDDKCPQCGSTEIRRVRRITGYLGDLITRFGTAKKAEERDRRPHKL